MPKLRRTKLLISGRNMLSAEHKRSVVRQFREAFPYWQTSIENAASWDRWYRNELDPRDQPKLPANATEEIKALREESMAGWAKLVCDAMSQNTVVDDIRLRTSGEQNERAFELWERNSLWSRQTPVVDGAVRHGKAFNLVLPAVGRLDGKRTASIRGKSALNCDAFFLDDFDEFPQFFAEGKNFTDEQGHQRLKFDWYDEFAHHWITCDTDGRNVSHDAYEPHGMGICPAIRFEGTIDLMGRATGEIEPYVKIFKRINQSTMDRLIVQRYGAFIVRWIAGMEEPTTDEEKRAAAMALAVTDLLVAGNAETKFGSLPATPLDGFLQAHKEDVQDLAAISQTPSFRMSSLGDNVGADGLAAAEAAHMRKGDRFRAATGEKWEASIRLGGQAAGMKDVANDFESKCHFIDVETRSFQSYAQGLQQFAQGLGIPGEALWHMVPDFGPAEREKARRLMEEAEAKASQDADEEAERQIKVTKETASAKQPARAV